MPSGKLLCPKCHNPGMSDFLLYESKKFEDCKDHWIFYNRERQYGHWRWKCWALVEVRGYPVKNCFDPFGWCFDPCKHTPDVITYENGREVSRSKDFCIGYLMCALFLVVCTLIYMLYFTIFIWYDIFYCCCEPLDYHKVICTGDRKESIPDDSDYWTSDKAKLFTEEYWCKNYPKLFKCTKCNHSAESFKDFLDYKQISENSANDDKTHADVTMEGINVKDPNPEK